MDDPSGTAGAYLRTVWIVALAMAVLMAAPVLPSLELLLPTWAVSVIFQGAYAGSVMAAIQVTVPNQQRGLATALLLLMSNLGGLALGSALIGGASATLFASDPAGVGKALALIGLIAAGLSAWIAHRGLVSARR